MANVKPATELAWCEQNKMQAAYALLIPGMILLMGGLGTFALGASLFPVPSQMHLPPEIWKIIEPARDIFPLLWTSGVVVAIIGGSILACGASKLYDAHKDIKNKPEKAVTISKNEVEGIQAGKTWKGIALVMGFAILIFGIAMLISGIAALKCRALDDVKAIEDSQFSEILKREWLNPFITRLTLMATAGAVTGVAGGCIMVLGGIGGHIRGKWNSWFKEEEERLNSDHL